MCSRYSTGNCYHPSPSPYFVSPDMRRESQESSFSIKLRSGLAPSNSDFRLVVVTLRRQLRVVGSIDLCSSFCSCLTTRTGGRGSIQVKISLPCRTSLISAAVASIKLSIFQRLHLSENPLLD